jgi:hypothetical protein
MNTQLTAFLCIALILRGICLAQVSSTPPKNWESATAIDLDLEFSRLKLSHNTPELVYQEILDTNIVRLLAASCGLTDADLATVQVARKPGYGWVEVYQIGSSKRASEALSVQLRKYVRTRADGHTRAFVLAALTNRAASSRISDPALRAIASESTFMPVSWLKKAESGTTTNNAGKVVSRTISITMVNGKWVTNETAHIPKVDEVCRWVSYTLVDGEVGWRYFVTFKADGSLDSVHESKCDAKEYDPRYESVIKEVDNEVQAEMKRNGSYEQFGAINGFWHLKKQKLKARGIDWRSPSDLNPFTSYD